MDRGRKEYLRTHNQMLKNVKRVLKDSRPWDYHFMLDIMIEIIKEMKHYYEQGYNVHSMEIEGQPTRLEITHNLIELYDVMIEEDTEESSEKFWKYFTKYYRLLWD